MATFTPGQTLTLTLDYDDYVQFSGSGNMTVTPYSGSSWQTYLTGNQVIGPFKTQSTTVVIACASDGTYTQASDTGVDSVARLTTDTSGHKLLIDPATGTQYAIVRTHGNKLAVIGDSVTARGHFSSATGYSRYSTGFLTQALTLSNHRMSVVYNSSTGGSGVTGNGNGVSFDTQLAGAIVSGADNLLMLGGENDFILLGATVDQVIAKLAQQVALAVNAGMRVWLCTLPPISSTYGGYSVALQGKFMQLNSRIRSLCASTFCNKGVICVDLYSVCVDPANATGNWKTNYSDDGQHPRNVGAYYMGVELARLWNLYVPEGRKLLSSTADNYVYSSSCDRLNDNGLFLNGAAPGTGWAVTGAGGATSTNTLVSRSDGFGNDLNMALTLPASSTYEVRRNDYKTRISDGDYLFAECEVTVVSPVGVLGVQLSLDLYGSITNYTSSDDAPNGSYDIAIPAGYTKTLRTQPFRYTAAQYGTISASSMYVTTYADGTGGSATVKVGRFSVNRMRNDGV